MRVYCIVIIIILTSCKSVELKQPVWYFWPIKLHLGTDISVISGQLKMDATKYSKTEFAQQMREYKLKRSDLNNLNFNNNYADSIKLYFYKEKLFSVVIYASENRNVEYLKFGIKGEKETRLVLGSSMTTGNYQSTDTTFNYGKYRELSYTSTDGHMRYEYNEDIDANTATLVILNDKMLKTIPHKKTH